MLYRGDQCLHAEHRPHPVWTYNSDEPLYNFGCDFVLPGPDPDATLIRLILDRDKVGGGPDAILHRIASCGGHVLVWS